jgi:hypothetical protein
MVEVINILVGITVLVLGYFIGVFLAKQTKEEIGFGQHWFKIIIIVSFIGAIFSLIFNSDALMFSFLFIAIVTSGSLRAKKKKTGSLNTKKKVTGRTVKKRKDKKR